MICGQAKFYPLRPVNLFSTDKTTWMVKLNCVRTTMKLMVILAACSLAAIGGFTGILSLLPVAGANSDISTDTYKVTLLIEKMPLVLSHGSATWDGKYAYIFGGFTGLHTSGVIVQFDPNMNTATALLDNLPSPRSNTAAVYAEGPTFNLNNVSYIIGGSGGWGGYDPSVEVVRFFGRQYNAYEWYDVHYWPNGGLNPGRTSMSAIWNGKAMYLFGGLWSESPGVWRYSDDILKYTLLGSATVVAKLPHPMGSSSAIWDGKNAYIFGDREIVRFNPDTNELVTMNATLPTARTLTCAVWDGKYAYIIGGQGNETDLDEILRYNPSTDTLQTLPVKLPFKTEASMAIWNGTAVYIFGGGDFFGGSNAGDRIVMLSTTSELNPSQGPNPILIYISLVAVAVAAVCLVYVFASQRKRKIEQNQQSTKT